MNRLVDPNIAIGRPAGCNISYLVNWLIDTFDSGPVGWYFAPLFDKSVASQ
jgi:hypothetical protein